MESNKHPRMEYSCKATSILQWSTHVKQQASYNGVLI